MVAASLWLVAEFPLARCRVLDLLLGMTCDDLVLDLVVRGLRKNASGDELVLRGIGAAVDDALGVGVADAGESLELVGGGGVNVERRSSSSSGCGWFGGLGNSEQGGKREQEGGGDQLAAKIEHRGVSLVWAGCFTAEEYERLRGTSMSKFEIGLDELTSRSSKATLK
jgi:hypothetical protein